MLFGETSGTRELFRTAVIQRNTILTAMRDRHPNPARREFSVGPDRLGRVHTGRTNECVRDIGGRGVGGGR